MLADAGDAGDAGDAVRYSTRCHVSSKRSRREGQSRQSSPECILVFNVRKDGCISDHQDHIQLKEGLVLVCPRPTQPMFLFSGAHPRVEIAILHPRPLSSVTTKPYHIVRNSRGSLPVYTDLRKGGAQYYVLVRNIEGDANAMLRDLRATLFPPGSEEAAVFRGEVVRSKHLRLQGPKVGWKANVEDWLKLRGF